MRNHSFRGTKVSSFPSSNIIQPLQASDNFFSSAICSSVISITPYFAVHELLRPIEHIQAHPSNRHNRIVPINRSCSRQVVFLLVSYDFVSKVSVYYKVLCCARSFDSTNWRESDFCNKAVSYFKPCQKINQQAPNARIQPTEASAQHTQDSRNQTPWWWKARWRGSAGMSCSAAREREQI